jgi:hypothetical protein
VGLVTKPGRVLVNGCYVTSGCSTSMCERNNQRAVSGAEETYTGRWRGMLCSHRHRERIHFGWSDSQFAAYA